VAHVDGVGVVMVVARHVGLWSCLLALHPRGRRDPWPDIRRRYGHAHGGMAWETSGSSWESEGPTLTKSGRMLQQPTYHHPLLCLQSWSLHRKVDDQP
jgi:hypothetical protein